MLDTLNSCSELISEFATKPGSLHIFPELAPSR